MKRYTILTLAPVLALLAVGCSSPVAMQSSEYDDMYYSSADETVYLEPETRQRSEQAYQSYENENNNTEAEREALADGEVLNPEYSEEAITRNYDGDEYYDGRSYSARDNWYRPDYSFVDPYWGMAYMPRAASYAYYDPFYDPFYYDRFGYDPFWDNRFYGNGLRVNISYGMGFGFGNHFGYGYPRYSNWWPNSYGHGFYNGFHNGYRHGYYANNPYNWYYDRPVVIGQRTKTQYGPRDSRSKVATTDNAMTGRPERGQAIREERTEESRRDTGRRQTRSSNSTVAPATGTHDRVVLPSRPSRRSDNTTTTQPQEQRVQPAPTERRSRRNTDTYSPSRSSEQRQAPSRTYESRPSRREESRPAPTPSYERSSSSSSSSETSSGSSSGGGRPSRRGNN